ncbi:MAG: ATP-dependent helicase HrpB [Corynebacterium sp.]|uniref:ATP-dependent helicase HrpB n=1 Tax=Corynebacterium sp. TaxID=1720 RepID=UPI0026DB6FDD|nr:ATP-dependent helicase HrpB [Corynebacterium sp.]MDO5099506.1 ATP-dependent helicase HrpB [Corynebacterium sp.]
MIFDFQSIGTTLPVSAATDRITAALADPASAVVVQAPPGTGKTTVVPPAVANLTAPQKVIVTAPRRVAVRAAARRLAELDGSTVGDRIGYSVRGDARPGSSIEFVTPGILVRRLLRDPELPGVGAVVIDEVHERQVETDLLLGMLLELQQLRDDLRLIAMSATVDADRFARLLSAPVIATDAVTFPLDISYQPVPGRAECSRDFISAVAQHTLERMHDQPDSALVFLPGLRQVEQCQALLADATDIPVFALHGQLSAAQQDRALRFDGRRIVVATAIAESSITVPGVRLVIDAGLARVPKRDAGRAMTGLVTVSCSKSSADQRAGRAGREGPGTVVRMYEQREYQRFAEFSAPEIMSADLTWPALAVACWGSSITELPLPDTPPQSAWHSATHTLRQLGAVDIHGQVTDLGRKLALVPADPRLARALAQLGPAAAETIAALGEDPRGDIARVISQLRPTARFSAEVARLARIATPLFDAPTAQVPTTAVEPGVVVGLAFPDQIANRIGEENGNPVFLLARGSRAILPAHLGLSHAEWVAVATVNLSSSGTAVIHAAAEIDKDSALEIIGISTDYSCRIYGGAIKAQRITQAGAIVLNTTNVALDEVPPAVAQSAIAAEISRRGLDMFSFSTSATALRHRLNFIHHQVGQPWVDVDKLDPTHWLQPELTALAQGASIAEIDMHAALRRLLPWPEASSFDTLAPETLTVASGRAVPIDYSDGRPIVQVKLQECFGITESPVFCGQPVVFHLLSPAGRSLAITDDLASFWSGSYHQVRAEMRGRYPKHPWPEDPLTATATAKTKRQGG